MYNKSNKNKCQSCGNGIVPRVESVNGRLEIIWKHAETESVQCGKVEAGV